MSTEQYEVCAQVMAQPHGVTYLSPCLAKMADVSWGKCLFTVIITASLVARIGEFDMW